MKTLKWIIMTAAIITGNTSKANNSDFMEIIKSAIQAPSGHNSQPWKFKIYESAIEVLPDFTKALPVVDSEHRELYISLGCAVENMCVAATEKGYNPDPCIKQVDDSTYSILVKLEKGHVSSSPLFKAIDKRQTNRGEYNSTLITTDTVALINEISCEDGTHFYLHQNGSNRYNALSEYIYKGNEIQMQDKAFKKELLSWIRYNEKQVEETKNGLTNKVMGAPSTPPFLGKIITSMFLNPVAQNKTDQKSLESSSHLVLFTTEDNTPEQWILLGRTLERFLLKTTNLGIANAYMNQPCEVNVLAEEIRENLIENNEYPTLLLRIGYADTMPYSPRKDVESVVD